MADSTVTVSLDAAALEQMTRLQEAFLVLVDASAGLDEGTRAHIYQLLGVERPIESRPTGLVDGWQTAL